MQINYSIPVLQELGALSISVLNCGGENSIRLGQFYTDGGSPWGERDAIPEGELTAQIISGNEWSDLPGTYTVIRVVASMKAMEVLQRHDLQPGIQWIKTRVNEHEYWAMRTAEAAEYRVLEEPKSVFAPIYRRLQSAQIPDYDLFLDDESHCVVLSQKLVTAFANADLAGYSVSEVH